MKGINDIIGQYNFAGFIKEEGLQTIGFSSSMGLANLKKRVEAGIDTPEDHQLFVDAMAYEKELLAPDIWTGIIDATPQKKTSTREIKHDRRR